MNITTALLALAMAFQQPTQLQQLKDLRDALSAAVDALGPLVVPVHTAAELQSALDKAAPGTILMLDSGAVYSGNFLLPARTGLPVTITSSANVPAVGIRPDGTTKLAIVSTPNNQPAFSATTGAHGYRLVGLRIQAGSAVANDLVRFGLGTETASALYPSGFVVDRCVIRGDPVGGAKRGILANAHDVAILFSDIRDIFRAGQDTTTVGCFNCGTGYVLRGNWLEAGGEVVIFGGAESVARTIATDVLVEDNVLTRPLAWRTSDHQVKNLFELKEGLRVIVRHNLLYNHWVAAQPGTAIVLTPRDTGKSITDVRFENNVIHDTGAGFSLTSHDDHTVSGAASSGIVLRNNLLVLDMPRYGGDGRLMVIGGAPHDVTFDHNTVITLGGPYGSLIAAYASSWPTSTGAASGGPVLGLVFTSNAAPGGAYGIIADQGGVNGRGFAAWFPGAVMTGNVLAGTGAYPGTNTYPTLVEWPALFMDYAAGDYRPSPLMPKGADGKPAGVDFATLPVWK